MMENTKFADKYAVREYIAQEVGEKYLVPLLGVWNEVDDIDFNSLPDQFVLKCTHDSGGVVICKDKSNFDKEAAIKKLKHCYKRNYYLNSDKKMLSIFLTNTCNLDCVYCYAHNDPDNMQIMSKEFAFWGVEYYYNEYIVKHGFDKRIRFYGPGEPTTQFALMKDIATYAKKIWGEDAQIEIQTNGCFSDTVLDWIEKNADNVWISCDGLPKIQNMNARDSKG